MPFEKGHPHYPTKDPEKRRRQHTAARRTINLAVAVNEEIEPAVFVQYWLAVASGKPNVRLTTDDDGDHFVTWDDMGPAPSDERRDAAVRELMNRGHGQAPQAHHVETSIRMHLSGSASVDHRMLAAKTPMLAMLGAYRAAQGRPAELAARNADAIDAEFTEPASADNAGGETPAERELADRPAGAGPGSASEDRE